jgi:hypothetical protein
MGSNSSIKWRVEGMLGEVVLKFFVGSSSFILLLFLFSLVFSHNSGHGSLFSMDFPDHISNMMQDYQRGQISNREAGDAIWKNLLQGRLTYLHWNKGEEMTPTTGAQGGTLLVRKIPAADPT